MSDAQYLCTRTRQAIYQGRGGVVAGLPKAWPLAGVGLGIQLVLGSAVRLTRGGAEDVAIELVSGCCSCYAVATGTPSSLPAPCASTERDTRCMKAPELNRGGARVGTSGKHAAQTR